MFKENKSKYLKQFILLALITWFSMLLVTPLAQAADTEGEGIEISVIIDSEAGVPSGPVTEQPVRQQEMPTEPSGFLATTGSDLTFLVPAGVLVVLGYVLIRVSSNSQRSAN